jgi:hypothetical protein
VDWIEDRADELHAWRKRAKAKQALLRALALARVNAIFTFGRAAGLAAVPIAAGFGFDQVRNENACIEVQLGVGSDGQPHMSWHLAYRSENTTDADLSYAGARRRSTAASAPTAPSRSALTSAA